MGPDGSGNLGAAGLGPVAGLPVSAPAFGTQIAPNGSIPGAAIGSKRSKVEPKRFTHSATCSDVRLVGLTGPASYRYLPAKRVRRKLAINTSARLSSAILKPTSSN